MAELSSSHGGHDQIRDYQIDAVAEVGDQPQCLVTVAGLQHAVAILAQSPARQAAHHFLVLDQEDRLGSATRCSGPVLQPAGGSPRSGLGKVDLERGALFRLAIGPYEPVALLDDAVYGGEAES